MDVAQAANQRMVKEFIELQNKMVLHCFQSCVSNFNHSRLSNEEDSCIDTCSSKVLNFNQRHMMTYMLHNKAQQEKAAKAAAEAQAQTLKSAATQMTGEVTPPVLAATPEHGSAPLIPPAAFVGDGDGTAVESVVPEKVCFHQHSRIASAVSQFADVRHTGASTSVYAGKSIVDQFLNSGTRLEFV